MKNKTPCQSLKKIRDYENMSVVPLVLGVTCQCHCSICQLIHQFTCPCFIVSFLYMGKLISNYFLCDVIVANMHLRVSFSMYQKKKNKVSFSFRRVCYAKLISAISYLNTYVDNTIGLTSYL